MPIESKFGADGFSWQLLMRTRKAKKNIKRDENEIADFVAGFLLPFLFLFSYFLSSLSLNIYQNIAIQTWARRETPYSFFDGKSSLLDVVEIFRGSAGRSIMKLESDFKKIVP